jgi:hypothetical protein
MGSPQEHRIGDRPGKLASRYVFLSASVPSRDLEVYRKPAFAHLDIEEAVVSLARAVFAEEGRLVFGGHPSISPLVASVAADYYPANFGTAVDTKPPVSIYQSLCYEGYIPDTTQLLRDMGFAEIVWTEPASGERFNPEVRERQCVQSIFHMRDRMIQETEPAAMVAIGGMDGVEDEANRFQSFSKFHGMVYVFKSTWGAAARLAESKTPGVIVAEERWNRVAPPPDLEFRRSRPLVPYAFLMQKLVEEIAFERR